MSRTFRLFAILVFSFSVSAQTPDTATITGTITDSSKAPVAGVQIALKSSGSNLQRTATTGATGAYSIEGLPISGRYEITASKSGFAEAKVSDVSLQGGATATINLELNLQLREISRNGDIVTVGASAYDASGVPCLDSRNAVRFSLAGEGKLIDNLGTARASRELQLSNGRAVISLTRRGACTVGVASEGLPPAFLNLS